MKFRDDLPFFLNSKNLTGKGVEVGVLRGHFSSHILKYWRGEKLYCVDAWRHIPGLIDINNPDHNGQLDNMARAFMSLYVFEKRAAIIREPSVAASELFQDASLDFVYLDAAHDYASVRADIQAWWPKIKPGGLLLGHDYLNASKEESNGTLFEVKKAVDEWALEQNLKVFATTEDGDFNSWWVEK